MGKSRFAFLNVFLTLFLSASFLTRAVLAAYAWKELDGGLPLLVKIFSAGLFFDLITFSYAALPLVFWALLAPERAFASRWNRRVVYAVFFLSAYALAFNGAAEYFFFCEFGVRFNFIAVDYLVYTNEVWGNIRESYNLALILPSLFILSAGALALAKKNLDRALNGISPFKKNMAPAAVMLAVPALAFAFVTLDWARIGRNEYADELASNGIYSLFSAFRSNDLPYDRFYASLDTAAAFKNLRVDLKEPGASFLGAVPEGIRRRIKAGGPEKKLNIVLIMEESLSADYLGAFGGGKGLTPSLDALARKSLVFKRLYAAGTRTVRGLEAVNLSMPPLPGTSIIKRPDNGGFFSWGGLMRGRGYDTKFIYAGYGYFDNMNSFFLKNGFEVVDRADFGGGEIAFANIWGVCDEDLLGRTLREADRSWQAGKPFFSLVMTTTNHRPFTYPDGRIDIPSSSKSRRGAIKYADYAVGRFLEEAARKPWFRDTIFIITADHCANSAGKTEIPLENYHIPMLLYSPAHIKPGAVEALASQIDTAPILLGLLNFNYETLFMGRDVLKDVNTGGRAFVSTYQKLGFLKGGTLTVLGPKKYLKTYFFDEKTEALSEGPVPDGIKEEGIAFYQAAAYINKNRLNRIK